MMDKTLNDPAIWLLPVTFTMVMSMGALKGLLGFPLPGIEIGITISAKGLLGFPLPGIEIGITISAVLLGGRKSSSDRSTLNWKVRRRLCGTPF